MKSQSNQPDTIIQKSSGHGVRLYDKVDLAVHLRNITHKHNIKLSKIYSRINNKEVAQVSHSSHWLIDFSLRGVRGFTMDLAGILILIEALEGKHK